MFILAGIFAVASAGSTFLPDAAPVSCPIDEAAGSSTVAAASARGELWLLDADHALRGLTRSDAAFLAAPWGDVRGLVQTAKHRILAASTRDNDAVLWQRESGGWREIFSAPLRGRRLVGVIDLDGGGLVTDGMVQTPRRTVAFDSLLLSRSGRRFATTQTALWIGANSGEWGGGLQRVSLADGATARIKLEVANVTGIAPQEDGCVLVSTGVVHFFQRGQVVRVCDDGQPEPVAVWHPPRAEESLNDSLAVFALLRTPEAIWAVTFGGLRDVDDPDATPIKFDFNLRCGVPLARPAGHILAIASTAIGRFSAGGQSPILLNEGN